MQRVLPALKSRRALIPVITFRWLLWALAIGVLSARPSLRAGSVVVPTTILVATTAAYTLLWTFRLPALTRLAVRWPLLLLVDLCLSLVPAWLSGGWRSPFALFALGALILPGALFRWRGALLAIAAYFACDQIGAWVLSRLGVVGPLASPFVDLLYLWPIIAAALWPLSLTLCRLRAGRSAPATAAPATSLSAILPRNRPAANTAAAAIASREAGSTSTALSLTRARPQTLEHPPLVELYASIRQVVSEAEDQDLTVRLVIDGAEPVLPPGHVQVATKAVEIALDNIRRHAHTREAEVRITSDRASILLAIRDQGAGLLDGTAEPPGFHQLKRLRYRLEEIEGSLDVRDETSGGVVVTARLPYQ